AGPRGRGPPRPGRARALDRSRTGVRPPAGADPALRDVRRRAVAALHDRRRRAPARDLARRTVGCSSGIGFASRPGAVRGATRILLGLVLAARAAHAAPSVLVAIGDRSPLGLPFSRFSEVALDGPDGLFSWDGSALGRIAVVGDASPAGGAFTSVGLGTLNDAGVCAFRASISSGPRAGIFRAVVSAFPTLATVALEGDATPIGGTLETFPTSLAPSVNAGGDVAFRATLAGDGVPSAGVFVAAAA